MAAALATIAALASTASAASCAPGTTPNCTDSAAPCEPYEAGLDVTIPDGETPDTSTVDSSRHDADADAGLLPLEASVKDSAAAGG